MNGENREKRVVLLDTIDFVCIGDCLHLLPVFICPYEGVRSIDVADI